MASSSTVQYVNIKITRERTTSEQKAALIRGVTQLLADLLGKNPATTVVVIDEVDSSGVSEDAKGAPAPAK